MPRRRSLARLAPSLVAAQALREFEEKTKLILKETQAKARSLESGADEAQISLRDSLRSQTLATQGRDQMQLSTAIMPACA